ncbi:MAG: cell division protein ZapA [Defluviitaleaceae bacterium]|nr:cell division protein ZapA [Defluviitaleaceae bacterium]
MKDTDKNFITVSIGGEMFELISDESEEYIVNLARYVNKKIVSVNKNTRSVSTNSDMMRILATVNVADDYFKEKAENVRLNDEAKTNQSLLDLLREENEFLQKENKRFAEENAIFSQKISEFERLALKNEKEQVKGHTKR